MTALLRHRASRVGRGKIRLTVYPNDGRTHADDYQVDVTEMRRFCWAVLAQIDPSEAQIAADEEGVDLAAVAKAPPPIKPQGGNRSDSGLFRPRADPFADPDHPAARLLLWLAGRGTAGGTLHQAALVLSGRSLKGWSDTLRTLKDAGYAVRADGRNTGGGHRAWTLTPAGQAAALELAENLPEAA